MRPQQRISLYSCLFLGGSSECESMCIAGGAQTPLAHCRSGDADPAASTPHPSRRSTPGSPTWAPTNLPMERKRQGQGQRQVRAPSTVAPHHAHFSLFPSTRESHQKLGPISPKPAPSPPAPARRSLPHDRQPCAFLGRSRASTVCSKARTKQLSDKQHFLNRTTCACHPH
jgi:hypothetical protein